MEEALLALEDGTLLDGRGLGPKGVSTGELVFNTSYTGYVEAMTDPSYRGQVLLFTYPLIGNYGVNPDWQQSDQIQPRALVISEACEGPVHRSSRYSLQEYLRKEGSRAISGIDTRALTIKIRKKGTMKGALGVGDYSARRLLDRAKEEPPLAEQDLLGRVGTEKPEILGQGSKLAVMDSGTKREIVKNVNDRGMEAALFPSDAPPGKIANYDPDGLLVTNGPGDPRRAEGPIETVKYFAGNIPLFGICLGLQIIALALGGDTYKMKFGHRGSNQPVRCPRGEKVFITSQNHGYAVDPDSLQGTGLKLHQINPNDGTLEALKDEKRSIFAVQYHPEASPGPRDTEDLFFNKIKTILEEEK